VKMLPFDNKSEFQVMVDMPEGTPLEQTARVAAELAAATLTDAGVADVQSYVGLASPYNFNDHITLTARLGYPMSTIGVSFLL